MNILLLCNKKNLLGNKLVIYTSLYCNSTVDWFICLTEEIGEQEERNLQNLINYLNSYSTVVFDKIDKTKSLEDQFGYLNDFWYISPDCLVAQNLETWYSNMQEGKTDLVLPKQENTYCTFYLNLTNNKLNNLHTFIEYGDNGIINLIYENQNIDYFDPRIGYCEQFSFNFHMPIIFWFSGENKKIYETNLEEWFNLYPDFKPYIDQIYLAETIHF